MRDLMANVTAIVNSLRAEEGIEVSRLASVVAAMEKGLEALQEDWKTEQTYKQRKRCRKKNQNKKKQCLESLETIMPENVNMIGESGEWEEIEMAVDSGATETVVGEDMVESVEVVEGEV